MVFVFLRVNHATKIGDPKTYPDSKIYLSVAEESISIENNWYAMVPIVLPLFYKLIGNSPENIIWAQIALSIAAWIFLASAVSRSLKGTIIKISGFSLILLLGLTSESLLYDFSILTESLSLSIMLFFIGSWLNFSQSNYSDKKIQFSIIILGLLWIFIRDTNTLLMLSFSLLLILLTIIRKTSKAVSIIGIILLVFCFISSSSGSSSIRWVHPNLKVVEQRILTTDEGLDFYIEQGMPISETLLEDFVGRNGGSVYDYYDAPELAPFVEWHREHGKQVYIKYLLSDPIKLFFEPIQQIKAIMYSDSIFIYSPRDFKPILPDSINNLVFYQYFNFKYSSLLVISFLISIYLLFKKKIHSLLIPIFLTTFIYPHALAVWTSSGGDVNRHSYQLRVQLRITVIIFIALLIGNLISYLIKNYFEQIKNKRNMFLYTGVFLVFFSLIADFVLNTGDTFSLGYAQIGLILIGLVSIYFYFGLKYVPDNVYFLLTDHKLDIASN